MAASRHKSTCMVCSLTGKGGEGRLKNVGMHNEPVSQNPAVGIATKGLLLTWAWLWKGDGMDSPTNVATGATAACMLGSHFTF